MINSARGLCFHGTWLLQRICGGEAPDRFDDQAMRALRSHGWSGNVRQLSHVVERAVLMTPTPAVRG